ncbi:MAG: N-acetylmuramoyl-L-alanine amidase [Nitrospirota bacterium]
MKKAEQCVSATKKSKKEKRDRASWLKCAEEFKKFIKNNPKSNYEARALFNLGNLYIDIYHLFNGREDVGNALSNYSSLIEKYPKSHHTPEAYYRKGEIYFIDLKETNRALQEFEKVTTRYPGTDFARKSAERISAIETERKKDRTVTVRDLKHNSTKKYTRIVVEFDGPFEYEYNRIKEPDRIFFDFKKSRIGEDLQKKTIPIGDGILKSVRIGQFSPEVVRVVLDLDSIENFRAFSMENPERLVIDISGISKPDIQPQITKETPLYGIRRIVIDPGHGGHDPGAIGKRGLEEKEIVLDIAKKLNGLIKKDMDVEVILTRDSDIFIPLDERTAIANTKEADLFLSIHANASPNPNAKGIETYFLNYTTDDEANRVAARENQISLKRQKEIQRAFQTDLEKTFGDLERDVKRDESLRFAHMVQNSMIDNLHSSYNVTNHGVKHALFYVLVGAKMPSILAEISFISNHEEERRLASSLYRQKIAESLLAGIKNYLSYKSTAITKSKTDGN